MYFMRIKRLIRFVVYSSLMAFLWDSELNAGVREERLIAETKTLNPDGFIEIDLNTPRYVQKIELTAFGAAHNAMFEVIVNGDIKGSIHVPGQDPLYWVTVADTTSRIILRHLSGGAVRILSMHAYIVTADETPAPQIPDNPGTVAEKISLHTIKHMSALQSKISDWDFKKYVLPIKMTAGHAYGIARASGDLSVRLRWELQELLYHFKHGHEFFESLMQDSELFDDGTMALELEYQLQDLLD